MAAPLAALSSRPSVARAGSKYPCGGFFQMPGYLDSGSAAHHFASPVLRCARDDSRDTCEECAIALRLGGPIAEIWARTRAGRPDAVGAHPNSAGLAEYPG